MDGDRQIVPRPLVSHVQSPYGLLPVRHQRNNILHSYYAPNSNKGSPGEATSILTPGGTVHITGMYAKANDAPCELIHDHEHPVCFEQNRLTSKQIYTPKTIFHMAYESQPGRTTTGIWGRIVVLV